MTTTVLGFLMGSILCCLVVLPVFIWKSYVMYQLPLMVLRQMNQSPYKREAVLTAAAVYFHLKDDGILRGIMRLPPVMSALDRNDTQYLRALRRCWVLMMHRDMEKKYRRYSVQIGMEALKQIAYQWAKSRSLLGIKTMEVSMLLEFGLLTEGLDLLEGVLGKLAAHREEVRRDTLAAEAGCRRIKMRGDILVPPGGTTIKLGGPGQRVVLAPLPEGLELDAVDPPGTPPPPPPMADDEIAARLAAILGGLCYF